MSSTSWTAAIGSGPWSVGAWSDEVAGGQQRLADDRRALRRLVARDGHPGHQLDEAVVGKVIVGGDERDGHRGTNDSAAGNAGCRGAV